MPLSSHIVVLGGRVLHGSGSVQHLSCSFVLSYLFRTVYTTVFESKDLVPSGAMTEDLAGSYKVLCFLSLQSLGTVVWTWFEGVPLGIMCCELGPQCRDVERDDGHGSCHSGFSVSPSMGLSAVFPSMRASELCTESTSL